MELALQVVGLKMTGKIEDAKNVAMRIVGNAGGSDGSGSQGDNPNMMQLASSPAPSSRDLRSLILHSSEGSNLESRIIDLLLLTDTPIAAEATASSVPTSQALSFPSPIGQTLLHLATFLGFSKLVRFLIEHGIDIDARDRNGFTALHFAALVKSAECARALVDAGADREIVDSLGKTPIEVGEDGFFDEFMASTLSDSDEQSDEEDEEAEWGDGEEDAAEEKQIRALKRRASQRALRRSLPASRKGTPRASVDVSRAATPPPPSAQLPPPSSLSLDSKQDISSSSSSVVALEKKAKEDEESKHVMDAKQTASFMEKMIQRTLAQLPAPQLPGLPGMVPWGALPQMPQIPMVFPVFVPMMPHWPAFLGGENASDKEDGQGEGAEGQHHQQGLSTTAMRAAQEWRSTWEKWVAMGMAATAKQQEQQQQQAAAEEAPPVYTANPALGEHSSDSKGASGSSSALEVKEVVVRSRRSSMVAEIRPVGYDNSSSLPSKEVDAFAYQPAAKQKQKGQKKGTCRRVSAPSNVADFDSLQMTECCCGSGYLSSSVSSASSDFCVFGSPG